jgi:hypothetical protein
MHRFSAEGAHIDFYKTKEIQARVKQHLMLSEEVPYQTAHVWRTKEMEVSAQRGTLRNLCVSMYHLHALEFWVRVRLEVNVGCFLYVVSIDCIDKILCASL